MGRNNESAVPVVQHGELMCNVIGHWTLEIWGKADLMCGEMFIGHSKTWVWSSRKNESKIRIYYWENYHLIFEFCNWYLMKLSRKRVAIEICSFRESNISIFCEPSSNYLIYLLIHKIQSKMKYIKSWTVVTKIIKLTVRTF